jgi:hypothetical protein
VFCPARETRRRGLDIQSKLNFKICQQNGRAIWPETRATWPVAVLSRRSSPPRTGCVSGYKDECCVFSSRRCHLATPFRHLPLQIRPFLSWVEGHCPVEQPAYQSRPPCEKIRACGGWRGPRATVNDAGPDADTLFFLRHVGFSVGHRIGYGCGTECRFASPPGGLYGGFTAAVGRNSWSLIVPPLCRC